MTGAERRLNYLEQTKNLIRGSINTTGGELSQDAPLDDYSDQVQVIIDTTIIPQSDLDALVVKAAGVNGEMI